MANIVVVDAHPIARVGLRCILQEHNVIAEGSAAADVLPLAEEAELVIVDTLLNASRIAAATVTPIILCAEWPRVSVPEGVRAAVGKQTAGTELPAAVDAVLRGDSFRTARSSLVAHELLSPREAEVMSLILDGKRMKEIAFALEISIKTVSTHHFRLLRKLGLPGDLALLRYAIAHELA